MAAGAGAGLTFCLNTHTQEDEVEWPPARVRASLFVKVLRIESLSASIRSDDTALCPVMVLRVREDEHGDMLGGEPGPRTPHLHALGRFCVLACRLRVLRH